MSNTNLHLFSNRLTVKKKTRKNSDKCGFFVDGGIKKALFNIVRLQFLKLSGRTIFTWVHQKPAFICGYTLSCRLAKNSQRTARIQMIFTDET
jgi:hypothetical protein